MTPAVIVVDVFSDEDADDPRPVIENEDVAAVHKIGLSRLPSPLSVLSFRTVSADLIGVTGEDDSLKIMVESEIGGEDGGFDDICRSVSLFLNNPFNVGRLLMILLLD